jgi:TPR repeat protein
MKKFVACVGVLLLVASSMCTSVHPKAIQPLETVEAETEQPVGEHDGSDEAQTKKLSGKNAQDQDSSNLATNENVLQNDLDKAFERAQILCQGDSADRLAGFKEMETLAAISYSSAVTVLADSFLVSHSQFHYKFCNISHSIELLQFGDHPSGKNITTALAHYDKAARLGDPDAQHSLALFYGNGFF